MKSNYVRARELQAEHFVDELVEISDSATPEDAQAKRLRVETRKWVAGRMLPKKYGDKAGDIHLTSNVQNFVVLPVAERERLVTLHREALQR